MANKDTRTLEERIEELQAVVTKLFVQMDAQRIGGPGNAGAADGGELPDFGPWMDTTCCYARVIALRTDLQGRFQFATLKLLHDCSDERRPAWREGAIFDLRNPAWEAELKRAQNHDLLVGVRVLPDGRVVGIELARPNKKPRASTPGVSQLRAERAPKVDKEAP
ncbi:hypothetical protein [Meiothermus hypogaeus]|uniref:Uncharacterized protein n=1 Tax=Meiothermus hypogaeus NBRC 106114 TaxID=1227553 RepID=A0A511QZU8_9DEIN|nr:hypothetical protein [Meiothermus hypogaeus]GEM82246.1 hypothetical protein MHY01S_04120 [Meiothermus hypogaeus NBRC 106114]